MFCAEVNVGMLQHLNLIKIRCLLYLFLHPIWGHDHVRVHVFNQPIGNKLSTSLGIKRSTCQVLLSGC